MKLLTLNCHSWIEENQLEKINFIIEAIKENQYDVIALQEVNQSIECDVEYDNIKSNNFALILQRELNKISESKYSFIWDYSHIGYDIYEEGVALLTKHEIKESRSFYISQSDKKTDWKSRNIVNITIDINGEEIDFYSCHTGWWNDESEPFKYQADKLLKEINNERLSFIMGDFNNNAYVRNEGYDYLINSGLFDTYNLSTNCDDGITVKGEIAGWESQSENKRLDLILANRDVKVIESKVIFNGKNREIVSDHYGVEVVISKE